MQIRKFDESLKILLKITNFKFCSESLNIFEH